MEEGGGGSGDARSEEASVRETRNIEFNRDALATIKRPKIRAQPICVAEAESYSKGCDIQADFNSCTCSVLLYAKMHSWDLSAPGSRHASDRSQMMCLEMT
jgi:hypothetical protein